MRATIVAQGVGEFSANTIFWLVAGLEPLRLPTYTVHGILPLFSSEFYKIPFQFVFNSGCRLMFVAHNMSTFEDDDTVTNIGNVLNIMA